MRRIELKAIGTAAAINVAIALLLLTLTRFTSWGDNHILSFIAQGVYDSSMTAYLIFPNILFGLLVSALQAAFSGVNWMTVLQLLLSVVAFTYISTLLINRIGYKWGIFSSVLVTGLFGRYHFQSFEFTQNAFLYCAAGMFGLVLCLADKEFSFRKNKGRLIIAAAFLWCGYGVRNDCFFATAPFLLVMLGILVIEKKTTFCNALGAVTVVVAGLLVMLAANSIAYAAPDWKMYLEYNQNRARIMDYGIPDYEVYEEVYRDIGLNRTDYEMLQQWMYDDLNVFTPEAMEKLAAINKVNITDGINKYAIYDTFYDLGKDLKSYTICIATLCLALLFLILLPLKKCWHVIGTLCLLWLEYWYLNCQGRMPFRTIYGVWFLAFLSILSLLLAQRKLFRIRAERSVFYMQVAVGLMILVLGNCDLKIRVMGNFREINKVNLYDRIYDNAIDNKEILYVSRIAGGQEIYSLFRTEEKDLFSNVCFLGGWIAPSPLNERKLESFGGDNVMEIMSKGGVYLIARREIDVILEYIDLHYQVKLQYEITQDYNNVVIYYLYLDNEEEKA